jgi:endonuclease/exonuclease/phosphatase family metal-dependent hydrolase
LTIRIATWNVERPRAASWKKVPALMEHIRRVDADIWILTETHLQVSPGAGYEATSTAESDRDQADGEKWVTIWSRLPIVAMPRTSDQARTACVVVRTPQGNDLIVYGTVLPWLGSSWREHAAAEGQAFAAALDTQACDWSALREQYPGARVCIGGDFNQDLQVHPYYGSARNRLRLEASLSAVGVTCVTAGENDPVWKVSGGRCAAVDHLCLDSASQRDVSYPAGAWPEAPQPDRTVSDHYGLWIDLTV